MKLYNIRKKEEKVTFFDALLRGLGKNQGLFFFYDLPKFSVSEIKSLLKMNFVERSAYILSKYIDSEISYNNILTIVRNAFNFLVPLVFIKNNIAIAELFHGPTLAFKDFGTRFMAQMLMQIKNKYTDKPMVILTATSGDTGAAVAHAFYEWNNNIHVIILYPKGKISVLQEKLFCTLGKNISTVAIDGNFDVCQNLVKRAFEDNFLNKRLYLNSANSINISRLLAQVCYYFEVVSKVPAEIYQNNKLIVSVPSGNFGNLTAGLLAQISGLPVHQFIAATNVNDTVPRYLRDGIWNPLPTIETFSNAMDVSCPSNWERIIELFHNKNRSITELRYGCVNDEYTKRTIQEMVDLGYVADPHTAVAYRLLCDHLDVDEFGICLSTAHPAKFKELVEYCLENKASILLPNSLKKCMDLPILSYKLSNCFSELRNLICELTL